MSLLLLNIVRYQSGVHQELLLIWTLKYCLLLHWLHSLCINFWKRVQKPSFWFESFPSLASVCFEVLFAGAILYYEVILAETQSTSKPNNGKKRTEYKIWQKTHPKFPSFKVLFAGLPYCNMSREGRGRGELILAENQSGGKWCLLYLPLR